MKRLFAGITGGTRSLGGTVLGGGGAAGLGVDPNGVSIFDAGDDLKESEVSLPPSASSEGVARLEVKEFARGKEFDGCGIFAVRDN